MGQPGPGTGPQPAKSLAQIESAVHCAPRQPRRDVGPILASGRVVHSGVGTEQVDGKRRQPDQEHGQAQQRQVGEGGQHVAKIAKLGGLPKILQHQIGTRDGGPDNLQWGVAQLGIVSKEYVVPGRAVGWDDPVHDNNE